MRLLAAAALGFAAVLCGCGGPSKVAGRNHRSETVTSVRARPEHPVASLDAIRLPVPVSGEAVFAQHERILVLGGLDGSDVSTAAVVELDPGSARSAGDGALGEPRHDLAAAEVAGRTLVFGGGSAVELDSVESLPGGAVVGTLPSARSDLSAVALGAGAYVLGGYDGREPVAEVLRTSDGRHFTAVARLPVPFRYSAVVAIGPKIYCFGGELASGKDSSAIQVIDTRAGTARVVGHLARPLSHASAVVLGGKVFVLGGRSAEAALRQIVAFDPKTRSSSIVGHLPFAVTNAAAAQVSGSGYLVGGLGADGQTLDTVIVVRLRAGP